MAAIKHTKNELKAQREALRRFERFLPMLQLKKQQLQMELRQIEQRIEAKQAEAAAVTATLQPWVRLAALLPKTTPLVTLRRVLTDSSNIAGITIPVYRSAEFDREPLDLFATPPWHDDLQRALESLIVLRAEKAILDEQHRLISAELRTTSQRVNLFEKVKIPECRENIRVIRIFLGDEQAAAVARAKFAKKLATEAEAALAGMGSAA